jgi:anti-sigma factor RsiW
MSLDHEAVAALLGAYSLDAVEPDETAHVEAHLVTCTHCTSELVGFREAIGLVANSGGDAPMHLWGAIAARLGPPPAASEAPVVSHLFAAPQRLQTEGARSLRRWHGPFRPWALGAMAAALVVIAVLGVHVGRLDHRVNQLQALTGQQSIAEMAGRRWPIPKCATPPSTPPIRRDRRWSRSRSSPLATPSS